MTKSNNYPTRRARQTAESLLATRLGGPVRLNAGANLPDHAHVFRFAVLDAPANAPDTVMRGLGMTIHSWQATQSGCMTIALRPSRRVPLLLSHQLLVTLFLVSPVMKRHRRML